MKTTLITLANAVLVLPDRLLNGSLVLEDGAIREVNEGRSTSPNAFDLDGDYLLPGVVDLHTDNLERQVLPRSNARWPSRSAMVAHDVQCAAAGVTTLLNAVCLGDIGFEKARVQTSRDALNDLEAFANSGLLKSDHYLHLRCELPAEDMLDLLNHAIVHPATRMVSLMDHSPGVGQYADISYYRALRRSEGFSDAEIDSILNDLQARHHIYPDQNRRGLFARLAGMHIAIASHDDRTEAEVQANHVDGIQISEFPVTMEAARAAHARGMGVIAGAPNIVRGGSHSGNVAAIDMVREGLVTALASDYVPAALIEAAFRLYRDEVLALPDAVALITRQPAQMVGLMNRGQIAPGFRADLVRVRVHDDLPIVRQVWRSGERII